MEADWTSLEVQTLSATLMHDATQAALNALDEGHLEQVMGMTTWSLQSVNSSVCGNGMIPFGRKEGAARSRNDVSRA